MLVDYIHLQITPHLASSLKQIQQVDMSLHSAALFWFGGNQSLLLLLNAAFLEKKQQTDIDDKLWQMKSV
jgi:hypothetical protein